VAAVKRVLLASHGASFGGGGEIMFDELVRALRSRRPDLDLHVVAPGKGGIADRALESGAAVSLFPQPRWADFGPCGFLYWARAFGYGAISLERHRGLIKSWRPDLVLVNTMTIPMAALAAKTAGAKVVWLINEFGRRDHDLSFLLGYKKTMRTIGRLSDRVVCNSTAVADEMAAQGIPKSILRVGYQAVNSPVGEPRTRTSGTLTALVVGRIAEPKGQLLAVRAVAEAVRQGADVRLRMVGFEHDVGYTARVRAETLGMEDRIQFVGSLTDPSDEYRHADVLLMTSRDEAFGRVTVEAMRLGLPVIGVNSGGTAEIIEDGITGYLVAPGDAKAMGSNLAGLSANENRRLAIAAAAHQAGLVYTEERWLDAILSD
jgi:glycosyltransferase involved in cell wall biosynthesis